MAFEGVRRLKVGVESEENTIVAHGDDDDEPVSPTGQYFNSSALSVSVLALFDSEVPIDDSPTMSTLENLFLPIHPRFSSIMVKDEQGIRRWKRVKVKLEDHVNVPVFPGGVETYDEHVGDYLARIATEKFPQGRPLWNVHIIKYPTKCAAGTLVFKLHHALGDGFSLMGALFSCVRRADDPSLPLTFPSSRGKPPAHAVRGCYGRRTWRALSVCANTVRDFTWSLMKSNLIPDGRSPIRSGDDGVEFRPIEISTVSFSLDDIRKIKTRLGATVNDVITGIIFYGTQMYLQQAAAEEERGDAKPAKTTALVLLNTRVIASYRSPEEMAKPATKSSWGNQFGFLHVSLPSCKDSESCDPVSFVMKAKKVIKAKRSSFAVFLTGRLLEFLRVHKGAEGAAGYVHTTLRNSSMTVSNLIGPMEQMSIAGHAVRSLYFMVVGVPQSLTITVVSYMGKLKVAMGTEKGFINSTLLVSCMEKSFRRILDAACMPNGLEKNPSHK